ncbi:L,D-transpeptidase [Limimaricola cinnabarinus]|uniref:L,D-transpeptidase n=1 Tax=Limimaricola cinnabarinus TaxID=1125964 RepID=UPI0015703864|nr:L,D-transpeptidase [Limimaricola cinnabarinus]
MQRRRFLTRLAGFGAAGAWAPGLVRAHAGGELPERFLPREVDIAPGIPAGEIHVMPDEFALYWTLPEGRAIRYSVGVGRDDLYHAGSFVVQMKREWPSWKPTPAMVRRAPEKYEKYAEDGMPGGLDNPLGARALYLFVDGRDTYLRIHGTNQPSTIGQAVSNGCARLVNDHIIELYEKVPMGTKVYLHPKAGNPYSPDQHGMDHHS